MVIIIIYHTRTIQVSNIKNCKFFHCVKSVHIRSYSGPHFPAFRLNTERYSVSLRIQSECGKMRTRITPNTDTFYTVLSVSVKASFFSSLNSSFSILLQFHNLVPLFEVFPMVLNLLNFHKYSKS